MSRIEDTIVVRNMFAEHDYNKIRELENENESLRKENESLLSELEKAKAQYIPHFKYILWQCHEFPWRTPKNQKPACGQWNIKKVKIGFGQPSDPKALVRTYHCRCPGSRTQRRMSSFLSDKIIVFDSYEKANKARTQMEVKE